MKHISEDFCVSWLKERQKDVLHNVVFNLIKHVLHVGGKKTINTEDKLRPIVEIMSDLVLSQVSVSYAYKGV